MAENTHKNSTTKFEFDLSTLEDRVLKRWTVILLSCEYFTLF